MILENQNEINQIESCPLANEERDIILFRFCESNPIGQKDIIPFAILKPEVFDKNCLGWGLSHFNSKEATINTIKTLTKKKREKIIAIGNINIDNKTALKHQSGNNKSHYTVYPLKNVNFISKFATEKI